MLEIIRQEMTLPLCGEIDISAKGANDPPVCPKENINGTVCADSRKVCLISEDCDEPFSTCPCLPGFQISYLKHGKRNVTQCDDINECFQLKHHCGAFTECKNTIGGYYCVCDRGFRKGDDTSLCPSNNTGENACTASELIKECKSNINWGRYSEYCSSSTTQHSLCSAIQDARRFLNQSCQLNYISITEKEAEQQLDHLSDSLSQILTDNHIRDISGQKQRGSLITEFLYYIEKAVLISFISAPRDQEINNSALSITMKASQSNCNSSFQSLLVEPNVNSMKVPCKLIPGERDGVIFITYKGFESAFDGNISVTPHVPQEDNLVVVNSKVVSGTITNHARENLPYPVIFTLYHLQPLKPYHKNYCAHWNSTGKGWSDKGCETSQSNEKYTICTCRHLSSFAIIMAPDNYRPIKDNFMLRILTHIGLIISLVCLSLSLFTFLLCRSMRSAHTSVLTALCGCLFLAQLLFLVGIDQTRNRVLCAFIAGGLQFFFLCAFCWMSIESFLLFMTIRNLRAVNYMTSQSSNLPVMCLLGFGVPSVIVGISAAVHPQEYGTTAHCWLSHNLIWSFLGPVLVLIILNTVLLSLTLHLLRKRLASLNANVSTLTNTRLLTFKSLAQFCILGCTWGIGYFQLAFQSLVISYLFTMLNTLQGAYIFLVHCLLNHQVREAYRNLFYRLCPLRKQKEDDSTTTSLQTASKPNNTVVFNKAADSTGIAEAKERDHRV
ncbi:adhesion G protein-coupled receptor E3-like isoform X2 [Hyperolius riggenbachi]|uniref:adhesion G protein-coupled receptor E3-like isoform X2 n=1 Tax=Hyperolius riggenbachi TaxID=752182 RepID=UPI0035A2CC73